MDLRQLRYLIALAREKHFTRAADACSVTQPTLSARLRQLENDLGVPIVLRGHRYHGLTPEGEKVLAWARRIVDDCDRMFEDLAIQTDEPAGRLALGVIPSALPMAAELTRAFRAERPRIRIVLTSRSLAQIEQELDAFEIDAAITYLDPGTQRNRWCRHLYDEEYALYVRADHALAGRDTLRWEEAARQTLAALTPDMRNRRIVDDAFQQAGCSPEPVVESNSVIALATLVRSGAAVCVLPRQFVAGFGRDDAIRAVPLIDPVVRHPIGLVALNQEPRPPLVDALFHAVPQLAGLWRNGAQPAES